MNLFWTLVILGITSFVIIRKFYIYLVKRFCSKDGIYSRLEGGARPQFNFVIVFLYLFFQGGYIFVNYFDETYKKEVNETYIESLSVGSESKGDFFLGSGSIEGVSYYYYYTRNSIGYSRQKVKSNDTYIVETDKRRPSLVTVNVEYKDEDKFFKVIFEKSSYKVLYVPKGTIVKEFKI